MPYIELDTGIRMHYRDGGSGRPILFVPGFAATVDTWNYAVLDLHDRYRCVCVDLRGHGQSDKPCSDYTYDEMCGDLRAFLAAPRFKQTATEPFGMDDAAAEATVEAVRRTYPETMAGFRDANFHRTDLEATKLWFYSTWLTLPAYAGYKYIKSLMNEDLRDRLGKVTVPTAIFHGRHDAVCHPGWAEYMVPRITGARMVWFEESSHALMVEEPDKFSRELANFVG